MKKALLAALLTAAACAQVIVPNRPSTPSSALLIPSFTATINSVSVPQANQVFQRTANASGPITVTANAAGPTGTAVEARFNGGAWTSIGSTDANGEVTGTLTGATVRGAVQVRVNGDTSTVSVTNVGVGDLVAVLGQSNGSGRVTANQVFTNTPLATMYGNDNLWKLLADATDDATGQVDTVSSDSGALGSVWPLVANGVTATLGIPFALVQCTKGGTGFSGSPNWNPATPTDRTTLFGSAVQRMVETGTRIAWWWQGEDGGVSDTTGTSYLNVFNPMANAMATNISGFRIIAIKIEETIGPASNEQTNLWYAIDRIWTENTNALVGPSLAVAPVGTAGNIVADNDGSGSPYLHITSPTNAARASDIIVTNLVANLNALFP